MNHPRRPLKHAVDARLDEPRIHAAWQRIEAEMHAPRRSRAPMPIAAGGVVAGGVVAAALILAAVLRPEAPRFLALADGSAPAAVTADAPMALAFADASRIELEGTGGEGDAGLEGAAELVPTRNDASRFELALTRGRARFSVTPGGPRRWTIDCGLATVEVVGTVFTIERESDRVHVSVERGRVRVRADAIGVRELGAGESIEVRAPAIAEDASETAAPVVVAADTEAGAEAEAGAQAEAEAEAEAQAQAEAGAAGAAGRRSEWASLAGRGSYARAYAALGPEGTEGASERASPQELLLLADVARLSGHPEEAVAPLQRVIDGHPRDPSAAIAAIVLGRLAQDSLGRPAAAVAALERALELGVPAPLELDVRSRLALARIDLGDPRGIEDARAYVEAHPDGPRAGLLRARMEPAR